MKPQAYGTAGLIARLKAENPGAYDDYAKLIAEIERLSEALHEVAEIKRHAQLFANLCATCRRNNTHQWMALFATELSLFAKSLGDTDRAEYMPDDGTLRIAHQCECEHTEVVK